MKTTDKKTVIARVPPSMLKKLDAAARRSGRSRSAELTMRLAESLKHFPAVPAVAPAATEAGAA